MATLTSMNVSLPTSQKQYVKTQASACGCSTPSEYIRRLIHADQVAREEAAHEREILAALDAPTEPLTPAEWQRRRGRLGSLAARRQLG